MIIIIHLVYLQDNIDDLIQSQMRYMYGGKLCLVLNSLKTIALNPLFVSFANHLQKS